MKKKYVAPQITITHVEPECILAGSGDEEIRVKYDPDVNEALDSDEYLDIR